MDGDRHHWLEGRSSSQHGNVDDEDAATTAASGRPTASIAASASPRRRCDGTRRCNGGCYACGVADFATRSPLGEEDLLPDTILTCRVKIGEVGSAEILALGVLPMTLLTT